MNLQSLLYESVGRSQQMVSGVPYTEQGFLMSECYSASKNFLTSLATQFSVCHMGIPEKTGEPLCTYNLETKYNFSSVVILSP